MRILGILVCMMQCAFQLMSDGLVGMRALWAWLACIVLRCIIEAP